MATAANVTEEENILKCGICFDILTDPKVLECRHAFCADCIISHFKRIDKNCAPCPICRENYWPPKRNPERLPKCSIPLIQLLEIRKKGDNSCETESCENDSAPFICVKCRKWLCNSCRELHCSKDINDPISTQEHDAHLRFNIDPSLFDIAVQSRFRLCRDHPKYNVEWFCLECKKLICKWCRTNSHYHHNLATIAEESENLCNNLKKSMELLRKKKDDNKATAKIFKTLLLQLNTNMNDQVTSKWQASLERCENDFEKCDTLILLITHLLLYGSHEVIIDTFFNIKHQIEYVLGRCYCKMLDDERRFAKKYFETLCNVLKTIPVIHDTNSPPSNEVCTCAAVHFLKCQVNEEEEPQSIEKDITQREHVIDKLQQRSGFGNSSKRVKELAIMLIIFAVTVPFLVPLGPSSTLKTNGICLAGHSRRSEVNINLNGTRNNHTALNGSENPLLTLKDRHNFTQVNMSNNTVHVCVHITTETLSVQSYVFRSTDGQVTWHYSGKDTDLAFTDNASYIEYDVYIVILYRICQSYGVLITNLKPTFLCREHEVPYLDVQENQVVSNISIYTSRVFVF